MRVVIVMWMLVGMGMGKEDPSQACLTKAKELEEKKLDVVVMVVPLACSAVILMMTVGLTFLILRSEMRKLRAVEEAAFKVMDAVLRALLPDGLAEHLGCGIDNAANAQNTPSAEQPPAKTI